MVFCLTSWECSKLRQLYPKIENPNISFPISSVKTQSSQPISYTSLAAIPMSYSLSNWFFLCLNQSNPFSFISFSFFLFFAFRGQMSKAALLFSIFYLYFVWVSFLVLSMESQILLNFTNMPPPCISWNLCGLLLFLVGSIVFVPKMRSLGSVRLR